MGNRQTGLVDAYLADRLARLEITPSSADAIRPVLRQWLRHVDHAPPRQWTPQQVATWVNRPQLRASYRKSLLTKLRPFVHWLAKNGHLHHDPTAEMAKIPVPKGSPRDLTVEEVGQLLAFCPDGRAVLIVLLMVQLALRAGDVARIRIEDIDLQGRRLHVRAKGGRGEPTHWEPIPREAWRWLTAWLNAGGRSSGPLVRSYQRPDRGLQPSTVGKLVGSWMRAAGLKAFPWDGRSSHALRHTCAQHMLDGGAKLVEVQHTLGHTTIRSTEWYTRREPPGLRDAMEGRAYFAA